jgi:hypothetical protein
MGTFATWLNTASQPEFSDLVTKQFIFINDKVKPVAAQLFIYEGLTGYNSSSKRYDEVDIETVMIDLSPYIYEEGGGFSWTKIPDVEFTNSDITFYRTFTDKKYIGED